MRKLLTTAAISAIIAGLPAAHAAAAPSPGQDATPVAKDDRASGAPVATAASDGDQGTSLSGDIVVTARRRAESIVRVPVSITAVSGEGLRAANVSSIADISRIAPSLRISPIVGRSGVLSFTIRGMAETGGQITSDPAVGIYFADAIQTRPQGVGKALYDLDSIQILKGPQGTLFGRNLTGGAVLIQPHAAVLDSFEGYAQATYGNYDRRELQGAVNIPIGSKLALRVSGNMTRRNGYVRNLITGSRLRNDHTNSARAVLQFEPSSEFKNVLILDGYEGKGRGGGFTPVAVNPAIDTAANPYAARLAALIRQQGRSIYDIEETSDSPTSASNYGLTNTSTISLGDTTIKNIFSLRRVRSSDFNEEGFAANFLSVGSVVRSRQVTNELQLLGKVSDKLDYIVGGYFFFESANQFAPTATFGAAPRRLTSQARNESKSVFAQFDYHLTSTLGVTAGGRYTWDNRRLYQQVVESSGVQSLNAFVTKSFAKPTYTLSLNYQPDQNNLLYVTTRRGYRSGGFNSGAISLAALTPVISEVVTDYEAGFKSQGALGGMRYRTTMAVFHSGYDNVQRNIVALVGTPPAPTRVLLNVAKARVNGAELEATLMPIPAIELSGFVGYTDAKYIKFIDPVSGADLSGLAFSQTPKWAYRLSAQLKLPVPDNVGRVTLGADYSHQSEVLTTDAVALPGYIQPGYGLLSARLSFDDVLGSKVRAALFATNITKAKPGLASTPLYGAPFGFTSIVYGEPRMYGVELGIRF